MNFDTDPNQAAQPTRLRRIAGAAAGVGTATAIYGAEGYVGYAMAEIIRVGFQSPDKFVSSVSMLCLLGLMAIVLNDLTNNRGEFSQGLLLSGARAGLAVNNAIVQV